MGTFAFGWVRGIEKDNWQILWNPDTKSIYAKGAISKRVIYIGESCSWGESKILADKVQNEPEVYLNFAQLDNS